jgi:undecaprenyl-diphosphatase
MADAPQAPAARFGARAVLSALALALVAVPFALLLFLVQDKWRPLLRVDDGARDDLYAFAIRHDWFVSLMKAISFAGSSWVYTPLFVAVAVWLVTQGRRRTAVFVAVTMLGGSLLNSLVKLAVDRARPILLEPVAHAGGVSFPSGHAQSAVVATSVLLLVLGGDLSRRGRRIAIAAAVLFVLAVGFSRVALGVHYVSDVLAGYVLGGAWVAAMTAAFGAWRREERAATRSR